MFCIGVSFKKTPLHIRQNFAFSKEEQIEFIGGLIKDNIASGGVVVSTCNRSEIYFSGEHSSVENVIKRLAESKNLADEDIKKYCLFYGGKSAVKHLFNVACGLDSMILGEDEILRQVKEAYICSSERQLTDGEINIIFQDALNCAKSEKSATRLSTTPVSIGTIVANEIEKYFNSLEADAGIIEKKVLVVGLTGRTGTIVAKDLLSKGISVIGTSRRHHTEGYMYWCDREDVDIIEFSERYEYMDKADVIVSATSSPHYTLTYNEYLKYVHMECRKMIIDLAVPYDVDKAIKELPQTKLLDIDYFKKLSKENKNIRLGELDKAQSILDACVEITMKKIYVREFKNIFKRDKINEEKWFNKMLFYLKDTLGSDDLKVILDKIVEKEKGER